MRPGRLKRPHRAYSALFSATALGTFFVVAGVIGYDTRRVRGFRGTRWTGSIVLWEVAVGAVLLAIAVILFRRLQASQWVSVGPAVRRRVKWVGQGRSS